MKFTDKYGSAAKYLPKNSEGIIGRNKMLKRILKILLIVLIILILVIAGYIVYVFASYHRAEDNITLEVEGKAQESALPVCRTLTAVTYNLGFGAYSDDFSFFMDGGDESRCRTEESAESNIKNAVEAVKKLGADIYLFEEVDFDSTRSRNTDQRQIASDVLGDGYCRVFAQNYDSPYLFWPLTSPHGANKSGLLTFSKYGITSSVRRSLPIESGVRKLLDLDRCYSVSRIPTENGKELVVYTLHLSAYTKDGTVANEQLKILLADMENEYANGNYCIAGGDFNKNLPGEKLSQEHAWAQKIPDDLIPDTMTLVAPQADPLRTCRDAGETYSPETSFTVTLDGFIVSKNIIVIESKTVDTGFRYSDHNPAYINFILQ